MYVNVRVHACTRFEVRKLLNSAKPLNLFQRSDSGNLTRFQTHGRSHSTEPSMLPAHQDHFRHPAEQHLPNHSQGHENRWQLPNGSPGDRDSTPGARNSSRELGTSTSWRDETARPSHSNTLANSPGLAASPGGSLREMDTANMTLMQLAKEMEKRDDELLERIANLGAASPLRATNRTSNNILVSGSLASPIDSFLSNRSFDYSLKKRPPFAIETISRYIYEDRESKSYSQRQGGMGTDSEMIRETDIEKERLRETDRGRKRRR